MPPKRNNKLSFEPKDMVLAKMTGFPAWPSFVMPPEMIPSAILKAKKKTTNICVIFIPDGDFNWMNEKSLEPLTPEKLDARLTKVPKEKLKSKTKRKGGRTNNVIDAFLAAKDLQFDDFMEELSEQTKRLDEDDLPADIDDFEDEDPVDPEDQVPNDQEAEEKPDDAGDPDTSEIKDESRRSSKRKRQKESGQDGPSQPPDTSPGNIKEENNKDVESDVPASVTEEEDDKSNSNPRKKTRSLRSNGLLESNDTSPNNGEEETNNGNGKGVNDGRSSSPKPTSEKDRQHQLWLCRIKLQRSLIQRNQPVTPKDPRQFPPPTVDELLVARIILHRLADFPLNLELLRETKIHKVLKCILKDGDLEYPDSFRLHEKCQELLDKWKHLIDGLKHEKHAKHESRLSSQAPEDSEISGIETRKTLKSSDAEKIEV